MNRRSAPCATSNAPGGEGELPSRTDRAGKTTTYGYDITNRVTSLTAPLLRTTKYGYDTEGRHEGRARRPHRR